MASDDALGRMPTVGAMTSEHEREYLELLREVTERHKVFVEEYRRGELNPEVNLRVALPLSNRFDGIESISQTLSGWANLLCFPAAIALFIWSEWWVGLIVLIGGFWLWGVNREWLARLVIKRAVAAPEFFGRAVENRAIVLPADFKLGVN